MVHKKTLVRQPDPPSKWPRWTGFRGKTAWDWMDLLIVPLALVVIGLLFSMLQDTRQQDLENQRARQAQKIENQRAKEAQKIENQRAKAERELAEQRAQDEAVQAYLDQISSLLLERNLLEAEEDSEVRDLARARTLTVLGSLDPSRKEAVMEFLLEADLVQGAFRCQPESCHLEGGHPIIQLSDADLRDADLSGANLSFDNLSDTKLSNANLSNAVLRNAIGITNEELEQKAASLKGATMPNGQKYEDWIKDKKAQGKDEKKE
jgi:Pentapeptide repeats (8 copies)